MTVLTHDVRPENTPSATETTPVENFLARKGVLLRRLARRDGTWTLSEVGTAPELPDGPVSEAVAEQTRLRQATRPSLQGPPLRVVDLFAGIGGLTLGVEEAARALDRSLDVVLAVDSDPDVTATYKVNFPAAHVTSEDVTRLFDGSLGSPPTDREKAIEARVGPIDVVLGGPPCQGHSAFNNSTRHRDDRNSLYLRMARAAEVLDPKILIIENVPGALRDRDGVVQRAEEHLAELGYFVTVEVVDLTELGVPQRRKRLVLLASQHERPPLSELLDPHRRAPRPVDWAIADLQDLDSKAMVDQPARSAPATRERIQFLFDNDLYDLPNEMRPPCHQGDHSYVSVYGRMRPDEPAQTITRGFYSMCMGRYVHPHLPRTITAHEAARLQGFPDYFDFSPFDKRGALALAIGNAVPPKLSYAIVVEELR